MGFGRAVQSMPDGKSLLVEITKPGRGAPPEEPLIPAGPYMQESLGNAAGSARLEDMLQNDATLQAWNYRIGAHLPDGITFW
jgi:hypothetical protein